MQACIDRCRTEARELQRWNAMSGKRTKNILTEPARLALLGIPGAGKTKCLQLLRSFFEEVLGWTHGVQFQFLAPQNAMAALLGGSTVHTWGVIPVNKSAAASKLYPQVVKKNKIRP